MHEVDVALKIATQIHTGVMDWDGEPAILHPLAVGMMGRTDVERSVGFLHDALCCTDMNEEYLADNEVPDDVTNAVKILCQDADADLLYRVGRVVESSNPVAIRVLYNDIGHEYRRSKSRPAVQQRYLRALQTLLPVVEANERVEEYHPESDDVSVAAFAAGCFWGVQHYFQRKEGVLRTLVGYTGGEEEIPTYEQVRNHHTSHFEAVLVEYDKKKVSYEDLCKLFFEIHNPAQTDGQGPDKGEQYRSVAFINDAEEMETLSKLMKYLRDNGHEVNTLVRPLTRFWIAEPYHQSYYQRTGGSPYCHMRVRKF